MADATDSKSVSRKGVWVRVPPPVLDQWGVVSVRGVAGRGRTHSEEQHVGYVFGMFAVITMIGIGLGTIYVFFSDRTKAPSDH